VGSGIVISSFSQILDAAGIAKDIKFYGVDINNKALEIA
jgi:methylase of polypeptide subunit release factors